ncbi:hypothetical protein ACFQ3W_21060 [Paenibacillus puldeungensis]|uniref:Uncharacterized protein n=1 Tax=Paenibacillus puldeungensis TaxID=696536 RepID=A0ABW3S2J2_9BACL
MKLRIGPILMSVTITAVVLFGGWFIYREWAIQSPLEKIVNKYEGVNHVQLNITPDEMGLKLELKPGTDIGGLVRQIEKDGEKLIGDRKLKLEVEDHSSPQLDKLWQESMFSIAQAMENKQYTEITNALKQMELAHKSVKATAVMDDDNVYVTLTDGTASKYVILPRIPERVGAWPNA